jgi:hypothetical protein
MVSSFAYVQARVVLRPYSSSQRIIIQWCSARLVKVL